MDDLISREAAKKALQEKVFCNYTDEFYGAMQALDEIQAIDAAPVVHGEWVRRSEFDEDTNVYCCSVCGEPWYLTADGPEENNMHFCPNCGARMDAEEAHDDG